MNALVTGAGGFLGQRLVERLVARGDRVRALVRRESAEPFTPGVESVRGDLTDPQTSLRACRGIDCVFHAAAVTNLWGPWSHFHRNNVLATRHVVRACLAEGVARLVFTSSPSVVFDGTDQCGIDETAPYPARWLSHYPRSKALAEEHVLSANGSGGLRTCALRPHLIWGPGDRHLIPRLVERARAGRLCRVGDGQNRIDVVYIDNVVDAHVRAADALAAGSPVAGRAYFLSQGEPVNCWQWIDAVLALAGLPPVERAVSFRAAWRVGTIAEWSWRLLRLRGEPPMTRFLAAQLARSHYYDLSRARRDLGYCPSVSTEEGMRRLGQWLRASGSG
ncbi:MAG: NAD-dependent epimerase/dehydratase family protein [Pirellulales bacterium]|nr:NAD-dependent epimerase/dehydratase family protein [Pirellulales bacterium]